MEQKKQEPIRDASQLGTAKMLILGLQHMFAMFGATVTVPLLTGLRKYKCFSKLQFKSLRIKSNLFDEYDKDTCAIRKSDMIAFLQENSVYSLKDGSGECEACLLYTSKLDVKLSRYTFPRKVT